MLAMPGLEKPPRSLGGRGESLQATRSPGEPQPRDHWHVRISLIGLCLIFTEGRPPTSPADRETLLLLPLTRPLLLLGT